MDKYDNNNLIISIVIPVRNDVENLKKCLRAIMKSSYTHYECIIVDDGSIDETPTVAQRFPVKLIKLSKSHGPAYARNKGAAFARGEILFFIDADIIIYPDILAKVADTFAKHPDIDALIGSYDDDPGDDSFISQYKNLFHHYVHQISSEKACTFWSGCGAMRREIFFEFGGFDTSYKRPAIEDIELGFRLASDGHKILLQKQIQVKHLKRWTFWGLIKTDVFDRGVPWTKLLLRDRTFPKDLNLKISQRISVILSYLILLSAGILALFFIIPSFVLLLNLILVLICYQAYILNVSQRPVIIWTLTAYILFIGSFLFMSFSNISFLPYWGLFSAFILAIALMLMEVSNLLYKFLIAYKDQILTICIFYAMIITSITAIYYHVFLLLPLLILIILILLNHKFYKFYIQKRGFIFALMVIPMHVVYYLYSGISLILGTIAYFFGKKMKYHTSA